MDVPFHCVVRARGAEETLGLRDISDGGASFASSRTYDEGQAIEITIPVFAQGPILQGTIVWSRPNADAPGSHLYGVKFADEKDKQMLRLVEMICHIMTYRSVQEHLTGKVMSADEAAREWLAKYEASFPE